MKIGQLNLFIILGLAVLLVMLLYISLSQKITYQPLPTAREDINKMVEWCLRESVTDSLIVLGNYGKIQNATFVKTMNGQVALFDNVPALAELEQQTARLSVEKFDGCLGVLPEEVEHDDAEVTIIFVEETTIAKAHVPIQYTVNGQQINMDDFSIVLQFRFKEIYSTIVEAVALFAEPMLDINALAALPGQVEITTINDTVVVTMQDNTILLEDEPYQYRFAIKVKK